MRKGVIYVMVGLPATGKSTYISENASDTAVVLSSDALRSELLGDVRNQKNNTLIFSTLFERLYSLQKQKVEEIYIDATSVSVSDRRSLLNCIKRGNKSYMVDRIGNEVILEKFYKVVAVVFQENTNILKKRDEQRERIVGKKVIMRMLRRFVPPSLNEGFDELIHVKPEEYTHDTEELFIQELKNFLQGDSPIEKVLELDTYLSASLDCEQTSQWHQETLLEHLYMNLDAIKSDTDEKDMKMLKLITLFHDIGKPFVRNKKKDNLIFRGYAHLGGSSFQKRNGEKIEIQNYDDYQFLEHENFGANIFVSNYKDMLIRNEIITLEEANIIEVIVRGHLDFHQNTGNKSITLGNIKYGEDTEIFRLGTIFSSCDGKGRVGINDITNI